jgi:hypothetical protein
MKGHREARRSLLTDLLAMMSRESLARESPFFFKTKKESSRTLQWNTVSSKQQYRDTCKPKASQGASTTIWSLLRVQSVVCSVGKSDCYGQ